MSQSQIAETPHPGPLHEEETGELPVASVAAVPARTAHPLRRVLIWAVVCAGAVVALWLLAGGLGQSNREPLPDSEGATEADPSRVTVTVAPVVLRPVQRTVEATGTLYGFEEVVVSAKVEGRVRRVVKEFADRVRPNDLLLEIESTDFDLAVRQAEKGLEAELARLGLSAMPTGEFDPSKVPAVIQAATKLDNARLRMARRLAAGGSFSEEDRADSNAEFRTAKSEHESQVLLAKAGYVQAQTKKAALDIARQQLQDTQVRAPIPTQPVPNAPDGPTYAIAHRNVSEGSFVRVGTELYRLILDQTLKLHATVPERHDREVRHGQSVEVHTALSGHAATGVVKRISPAVDSATRTFEVEIEVANTKGDLRPGSFAKAAIQTRLDNKAATVPLTAVVTFAGVTKIFVVEKDHVKEVPVTLGTQTTEWVEIATPELPPGAVVVTSGLTMLADGTAISVRKPAPRTEPSPPVTAR
jgi:RND family efflux transporter MFP subunit